MIKRYPKNLIGYSGHEEEDNYLPTICSAASGAKIVERHFSNLDKRNGYSIGKEKLETLLSNLNQTIDMMGSSQKIITESEKISIQELQRGLFAKKNINKKNKNIKEDIYLAFPKMHKDQLSSSDLSKEMHLSQNINKDQYLIGNSKDPKRYFIRKYVHRYKFMLNEAGIIPGEDCSAELSHHYGVKNIEKFGAFLITVINGIYCKKLVCLLKDQYHPRHRHYKKIETFHVLYGHLMLKKQNSTFNLYPGDKINVLNNEWHEFTSNTGCIFEEISTESLKKDSEYFDKKIQDFDYIFRKTSVNLS
jgi:N-acetylneuraminate synthase